MCGLRYCPHNLSFAEETQTKKLRTGKTPMHSPYSLRKTPIGRQPKGHHLR